jgi:protein TonB
MKNLFLLAILLLTTVCLSQEDNPETKIIPNAEIDIHPQFKGGLQEFYKYIADNYRAPKQKGLSGRVFVTFVIEKDGSVTDGKIIRDVGHGTGAEALRVLKRSPKWTPGMQNGKPVRVLYSLPIAIRT